MITTKECKKNNQLFWETQEDSVYCKYKTENIDPEIRSLHCHDGYEILMIEQGNIGMQIEDDYFEFSAGDILLIPPYVFHFARQQNSNRYQRVVINFKESAISSLISKDSAYKYFTDVFYKVSDCMIHVDEQTLNQLILTSAQLEKAIDDTTGSFGNDILLTSLLSIILILLNRKSAESQITSGTIASSQGLPAVIKSVFQYVEDNLSSKITITDIADTVHLNSVYLTRLFHQYTGLSIQQYIIEKRLSEAKRLLKNGQSPTDVCYECGFNNYSNFSRTFSKHVKVSPRQFQDNSRAYFETIY
ncbi:MAG: AraC family transcriptional regulator [Butyrivibrio sp.]|nr:AraC family transcriptional regulator [Butyrivibrio sp.]